MKYKPCLIYENGIPKNIRQVCRITKEMWMIVWKNKIQDAIYEGN